VKTWRARTTCLSEWDYIIAQQAQAHGAAGPLIRGAALALDFYSEDELEEACG